MLFLAQYIGLDGTFCLHTGGVVHFRRMHSALVALALMGCLSLTPPKALETFQSPADTALQGEQCTCRWTPRDCLLSAVPETWCLVNPTGKLLQMRLPTAAAPLPAVQDQGRGGQVHPAVFRNSDCGGEQAAAPHGPHAVLPDSLPGRCWAL